MRISGHGLFALVSATLVAVVAVTALVVIGWPQDMRLRRLDDKRAADLTRLANAISNYRTGYGAFPQSLEDVHRLATLPRVSTTDPTGHPYEFRAVDAQRYELCANFDTRGSGAMSSSPPDVGYLFSQHPVGRHCFSLEAKSVQK